MNQICFCNDVLLYYGNLVGYREEDRVVIDALFDKADLLHYLKEKEALDIEIREGVYDRLSAGNVASEKAQNTLQHNMIRIYQLRPDTPILMRFISLAEREKRGFGRPRREEYDLIYEGEISEINLEEIWEQFARSSPKGFEGHSLSISDVIELSGNGVSRFFYIDRTCFTEVTFDIFT